MEMLKGYGADQQEGVGLDLIMSSVRKEYFLRSISEMAVLDVIGELIEQSKILEYGHREYVAFL
jgi:hypothetical protein